MSKRMDIHTSALAKEVKTDADGVAVVVKDKETGREQEFKAQRIMVAVGRKSNADLVKVENTGVKVDERGFIKVNEYLENQPEEHMGCGGC